MQRARDRLGFVWPILLGAALRVHALPTQILVDDEWHLVHKLRDGAGLATLVGDFGGNDHSIGLGACAWLLMRVTALDELLLRLPSLLAGVALIAVVPAALARRIGRDTALVLAWLLAVSPLLCFFSRLARPYAITTLLVSLAFLACVRWSRDGNRRAGVAYVVSAALAPLFHLPALPAALAPLALPVVARGPSTPATGRVARLALATVAAVAALLALPAWQSGTRVSARIGADHLELATIPGLLELLTGSGHPAVVAVVVVFALAGGVSLARRDPRFTRALLVVIALHTAAVVVSGAAALHVAIVAARYLAVVLPIALVFPAAGLDALGERLGARRSGLVGALAALGLFATGPLGWIFAAPNDFTNHISYQADYVPGRYFERFRPTEVSHFYEELAARAPASVTIVEAPWHYYFHPLAWLQRRHRQHVLIGFVDDGPAPVRDGELAADERGLHFRRALHLGDRTALRERQVDYVVLHRDPRSELRWPSGVTEGAVDVARWEARYREWFGRPVAEDAQLVVFAVR